MVVISSHGVMSSSVMRFCCERGIVVALTDAHGHWHGLLAREPLDRIATQRAQFRRETEPDFVLKLARTMVCGKLGNSRTVLRRYARRRTDPELAVAIAAIDHAIGKARTACDLDSLRGCEGAAAAAYFQALRCLLKQAGWTFGARSRPALDPFNAALNYGYSILLANVIALMQQSGLNPYVGYLHASRQGHPAGASDLMEEFRAVAVDAVLLALFLRKRLIAAEFEQSQQGVRISSAARRLIVHAIESRMNAPLEGREGVGADLRRQIERQARHLAQAVRGETPDYRAFAIR